MATVYRENRATPARQYISTAAFDTYFFTYTLTTDPNTFVQSGSFATVSGATATNCPRGRILRETGERLYPGQPGVNTLMVKVLDSNSCLSGYIDPNAEVFALYNADKPPSAADGFENNATSGVHKGPSLYTAGNIIADGGSLRVTGTADISGALTVASGGATITAGGLTVTAGKLNLPSGANGVVGNATLNGASPGTVTVANTSITANSVILLSRKTISGTVGFLTYSLNAGVGFTITSSANTDAGVISYMIVN